MRKTILIALSIFTCFFCAASWATAAEVKKVPVASLPVAVKPPASAPQPLPPSVVLPSESTYHYNPLGKTDPFKPFIEDEIMAIKKQEAVTKKVLSSIYPLQKMDVDKFRIVGIAGDQKRRIAMAEDTAKKYYPLVIGTHIGLNNGKVIDILSDRVIVEEYEAKKAKRIILRLRKNLNEVKP
jgi:type IV pilus assembly protein PilP